MTATSSEIELDITFPREDVHNLITSSTLTLINSLLFCIVAQIGINTFIGNSTQKSNNPNRKSWFLHLLIPQNSSETLCKKVSGLNEIQTILLKKKFS